MTHEVYRLPEAIAYAQRGIQVMIKASMSPIDDQDLSLWLPDAEVGEMFEYRIGVWVRLKDT